LALCRGARRMASLSPVTARSVMGDFPARTQKAAKCSPRSPRRTTRPPARLSDAAAVHVPRRDRFSRAQMLLGTRRSSRLLKNGEFTGRSALWSGSLTVLSRVLSDGVVPVFDSIFEQSWRRRQMGGSRRWLGEQFGQADKIAGGQDRRRTRSQAAIARVNCQSTLGSPRCRILRRPATVLAQPKASSMRLRMHCEMA
jgi:hypothetical protein